MIEKHQITTWLEHPVSKKMLEVIESHIEENRKGLIGLLEEGPSLDKIDLHVVSEIRGVIKALRSMLNIKTYLIEAIDDEVSSTGTEGPAQD